MARRLSRTLDAAGVVAELTGLIITLAALVGRYCATPSSARRVAMIILYRWIVSPTTSCYLVVSSANQALPTISYKGKGASPRFFHWSWPRYRKKTTDARVGFRSVLMVI
jgi:hypothetical protein